MLNLGEMHAVCVCVLLSLSVSIDCLLLVVCLSVPQGLGVWHVCRGVVFECPLNLTMCVFLCFGDVAYAYILHLYIYICMYSSRWRALLKCRLAKPADL
jgi:hypothetical protein